jgi:DNA replication licensing factor MCM6
VEEDQEKLLETFTQEEINDLKRMVTMDKIYSKLVNSLAPTVYGKCRLYYLVNHGS